MGLLRKFKDKQKFILILNILILISLCLSSCSPNQKTDIADLPVRVTVVRFDASLSELTPTNAYEQHLRFKDEFGPFYQDFIERILAVGAVDDEHIGRILAEISDTEDFKALSKAVKSAFPDLDSQELELSRAFSLVKEHFPEQELPKRFFSYFSGFSVQTALGEDYMGIGLDMFLGSDSPFYPALIAQYPRYMSEKFTPENIVPRVMETFIREEMMTDADLDGTFLAHMLHHGKVMYLMDAFLPHTPDSLKIGYTSTQMKWASDYQSSIWDWVLMESLLYENDYLMIQKHFHNAPFTPALGDRNESAPKLGVFLGWNMVRKYMRQNPETTLEELISLNNEQQILELSGYNGRR